MKFWDPKAPKVKLGGAFHVGVEVDGIEWSTSRYWRPPGNLASLFSPPKKTCPTKRRWKHTSKKHNQKCAEICSGEFGLGGLKLDWNLWLEKRQTWRKFGTTSTDFHLPIVFLCQWMKHPSHQLGDGEKYGFKNTHNEPKSYVFITI